MGSKFSVKGVRILVIVSSLLLLGAIFFPMWKIDLIAPQYPEGLTLKIWADKLTGDIETVNGLNHYIGMKKLKEDEFVEFKILPGLLLFFSLTGLLVGLINRRKFLFVWMALFIIFAAVSMADFYYWEYNYGHNLDPTAPIQVPGQAYQPPFIGYKQMLNFIAFSIPDVGGWFFIGTGLLMFFASYLEWKSGRKAKLTKSSLAMTIIFLAAIFTSCTTEVKPINYGKDDCDFCKMTIMDSKFGVEIITQKGKIFMMDDLVCAQQFIKNENVILSDIKEVYVNDYNGNGDLIDFWKSILVKNEILKSPMGGNMAAFKNEADADKYIQSKGGEKMDSNSVIAVK